MHRYQKLRTDTTVFELQADPGTVVEHCTIGKHTYVYISDPEALPAQPLPVAESLDVVTEEIILKQVKAASPHVALIDRRVVDMIREKYSVNDEIKHLRTGPTDESDAYNDWVEESRAWGAREKAKIGF